jgi:hypothetical protein
MNEIIILLKSQAGPLYAVSSIADEKLSSGWKIEQRMENQIADEKSCSN